MHHYLDPGLGCEAHLSASFISKLDKIDVKVITPVVKRLRRTAMAYPSCGLRDTADLPAEVVVTPFGPWLHVVATYLTTFQASSSELLDAAFADLIGLRVTQGTIIDTS